MYTVATGTEDEVRCFSNSVFEMGMQTTKTGVAQLALARAKVVINVEAYRESVWRKEFLTGQGKMR